MTVRDWRSNLLDLHVLLLRRRKDLGITQQALADDLGVKVLTIKRWENGHCDPSSKALWRWADALGVSIAGSISRVPLRDTREAA